MAFVDACWFTAGSSGTADFADGTALSAFRNMAGAGAVDGEVYSYRAESIDRTEWEMGYGAYSSGGGTLARTVTASSGGGTTKVSFSAAPIVSLQPLARDFGNLVPFTPANASAPASLEFAEDTDNGSHKVTVTAPAALSADRTVTWPDKSGTVAMESDADRRNQLLIAANTAKSLAAYQRLLDMVAFGFKDSGDADVTSADGAVDTSAGAWKPGLTDGTTESSASTGSPGASGAVFTVFDRGWQVNNGETITKIGIYDSSGASTYTIKIGKRNSAGNYDIVVSQAGKSHSGGGWQDFTLAVPFEVPATGNYFCGIAQPASGNINIFTGSRAVKSGDITGTGQTGFTEDTSNTIPVRVTYVQPANSTLITPYQTADAARTKVRGIFEIDPVDAITLGTDWTIEYTCNGGTNWSAASSYTNCGKGQSGRTVVETEEVTCTSGTSFAARVKNLNNKSVHVYKAALKAAA